MFQDSQSQFLSTAVEDEIALTGENLGIEHKELQKRIEQILAFLGITHLKHRSVLNSSLVTSWENNGRTRNAASLYVMQKAANQIFFESVEEELLQGGRDKRSCERAAYLLKRIDLWEQRLEHPQMLSGGEQQRLVVGAAYWCVYGRRLCSNKISKKRYDKKWRQSVSLSPFCIQKA